MPCFGAWQANDLIKFALYTEQMPVVALHIPPPDTQVSHDLNNTSSVGCVMPCIKKGKWVDVTWSIGANVLKRTLEYVYTMASIFILTGDAQTSPGNQCRTP